MPEIASSPVDRSRSGAVGTSRIPECRLYAAASSPEISLMASSTVGSSPHLICCLQRHVARRDVGGEQRREHPPLAVAVVARFNIQHPQRVPLGGLPAVWYSGARSRSCQLILRRVGKCAGLLGRTGPGCQQAAIFPEPNGRSLLALPIRDRYPIDTMTFAEDALIGLALLPSPPNIQSRPQ